MKQGRKVTRELIIHSPNTNPILVSYLFFRSWKPVSYNDLRRAFHVAAIRGGNSFSTWIYCQICRPNSFAQALLVFL